LDGSTCSPRYSIILIPPAVADELTRPRRSFQPLDVSAVVGLRVTASPPDERVAPLLHELHAGEAQAIALALELELGIKTILVDERDAYHVAVRKGLTPVGVLAVLLKAKSAGLVPLVRPLLQRLRVELNFFMSDQLERDVLRQAGE
jgi:predicted nucleic acid-binding protein